MKGVIDDLRHAERLYRRTPFQSLTAVLVIGLATAFATALFSLYSDLALSQPGGVQAPERMVSVGLSDGDRFATVLPGELRDGIAEHIAAIDRVSGAQYQQGWRIDTGRASVQVDLATVGAGYFEGLDVAMAHGRGLREEDFTAVDPVVVLAYDFWESEFGADPDVVGGEIHLEEHELAPGGRQPEDATFRIVGVADPAFDGLHRGPGPELWLPLPAFGVAVWDVDADFSDVMGLASIARLAPGADIDDARRELQARHDELRERHGEHLAGRQLALHPSLTDDPAAHDEALEQVALFTASALLVALIAAGNLSLFFLARAPARHREMGIRLAVGARPRRLARQLFTESSALVAVGALIGLVAALWLGLALRELAVFSDVAWRDKAVLDWPVLGFAVLLAALLAGAVGLAPVLDMTRRSIVERTRRSARGRGQRVLAAGQVAMAAVVLAVSGLLGQALAQAMAGSEAYALEDVRLMQGQYTGDAQFNLETDQVEATRRALREHLENLPGVNAIAFAGAAPMVRPPQEDTVEPGDARVDELRTALFSASNDWYEMLSVPILRGSLPETGDSDAVVVSREFAQRAWGGLDVVGQEVVSPPFAGGNFPGAEKEAHRVTAVIEDLPLEHPGESPRPLLILNRLGPLDGMQPVFIAGNPDPDRAMAAAAGPWADGSPSMEPEAVIDLEQRFHQALAPDRSRTLLSGLAGLLVIILAGLGFYGTMRFMVDADRFAYALRAALGASPPMLRRHVLVRGLALGLPGLAVGLVLAGLALVWLRELLGLYDIGLWLPLLLTGLFLGGALLLASWLPARRVAAMNPAKALRDE